MLLLVTGVKCLRKQAVKDSLLLTVSEVLVRCHLLPLLLGHCQGIIEEGHGRGKLSLSVS